MTNYLITYFILMLCFFISIKKKDKIDSNIPSDTNVLRGLICIIILLLHTFQNVEYNKCYIIINCIGVMCNGFFFFISGYGVEKKYLQDSNYINSFPINRFFKVLIPYIIINVFYIIYYHFIGIDVSFKMVIEQIMIGLPIVKYSWFITNLFLFYLAFWLLHKKFSNNNIAIVSSLIIIFIFYSICCMELNYIYYWIYSFNHLAIIGMIWAIMEKKIIKMLKKYSSFVLLFSIIEVIFFIICSYLIGRENIPFIIGILISGNFLTLIFIILLYKYSFSNILFKFLGKISMEIYLFHGLFILIYRYIINNDILFILLVLLSTIVTSTIFHSCYSLVLKAKKSVGG